MEQSVVDFISFFFLIFKKFPNFINNISILFFELFGYDDGQKSAMEILWRGKFSIDKRTILRFDGKTIFSGFDESIGELFLQAYTHNNNLVRLFVTVSILRESKSFQIVINEE